MNKTKTEFMLRLFWIYTGVSLFGVVLISLNNLYINDFSWEELIRFNLKAKLLIGLLMIVSFSLFTYFKFTKLLHFLDPTDNNKTAELMWNKLLLFPHEVFSWMLVFGVIVSPTYHILDFWLQGRPIYLWEATEILIFLRDFLFDQSLTLTLSVLLYSLLRYNLRSSVIKLSVMKYDYTQKKASFLRPLLLTFVSIFLITIFSLGGYVVNTIILNKTIHLASFFSIAFASLLFGLFLLFLLTTEFIQELQMLIKGIHALIGGERTKLHQKIAIISKDESGQLANTFNELQDYVAKEYADLEYELHLAYQVQRSLLPVESQSIGPYHIYASCQSMKQVGGDLYDTYIIDQNRFAILVGDVSGKGISAALLMSAIIHLFKNEMGRGGSAAQVLTRMNQLMVETLRGEQYITLGLAMFDLKAKTMNYASAGHVAPYHIHDGQINQVLISSLPVGIAKDEIYTEVTIPFQPSDQLILYTDGLIEKLDEQGDFIGFERFEQFLKNLDYADNLKQQFQTLQKWLGEGATAKYEDDRTLIMVRWNDN